MTGFGPYANTQVIDFSELGNRSFFLICGPTGSGKTTILDAISFVLYGDTSGNIRDGKQMRSDYADMDTTTKVVFNFALGDNNYRIERKPQQERPKRVGEGTTTAPASATVWNYTGFSDNEEGMVLADGITDVNSKVEELLGFKSSQFRQVVLLPQGDFRKLLLANSKDRQEILTTLFKTEYYHLIELKLKEAAKDLENEIEQLNTAKAAKLEVTGCVGIDQLQEKYDEHMEDLKVIEVALKQAKEEEKVADSRLEAAQKVKERIEEKEKAGNALKELNALKDEIDTKRKEMELAKQAASLVDAENNLEQRLHEQKEALQVLNNEESNLEIVRKKAYEAEKVFIEEENKAPDREVLSKEIINLDGLKENVIKLDAAKKQVNDLAKNLTRVQRNSDEVNKKHKSLQQELKQVMESKESATKQAFTLPVVETKFNEIIKLVNKRIELDGILNEYYTVKEKYKSAEAGQKKTEAAYKDAKNKLSSFQSKWQDGQAAVLAQSLEENTPCPVCGSMEHPLPAQSKGDIPSESELKEAQEEVKNLESLLEKKRKKQTDLSMKKAALEAKVENIEGELVDKADIPLKQLGEEKENLEGELNIVRQAKESLSEQELRCKELQKQEEDLKEGVNITKDKLNEANNEHQTAQAILIDRETGIPEELRSEQALDKAIKNSQARLKALEEAYKAANEEVKEITKQLTIIKTTVEKAKSAYLTMGEKVKKEEEKFNDRLLEKDFKDKEGYQQAKRPDKVINQLDREINNFIEKVSAANGWVERASKEAEGLEEPNLETLKNIFKEAGQNKEQLADRQRDLTKDIKNEKDWLKAIAELLKKIADSEKRYYVVGKLSGVANGKNNYNITLERFILGALLDDVLVAASNRLQLMSKGRYLLRRTMDRSRRNAQAGLELEVFDNYTGVNRHVSTLSGGETFLASLSLALGLADVIQAYSGGIRLDTIFVDEGFGTLDSETLDFAIKTLIDLQAGGRLVGIISHVNELKERIDARLEVTNIEKGSKARFKIS